MIGLYVAFGLFLLLMNCVMIAEIIACGRKFHDWIMYGIYLTFTGSVIAQIEDVRTRISLTFLVSIVAMMYFLHRDVIESENDENRG